MIIRVKVRVNHGPLHTEWSVSKCKHPIPCLSRPQDALIACKSKTIQASFDSLEDCFDYFSIVEPKVRQTTYWPSSFGSSIWWL